MRVNKFFLIILLIIFVLGGCSSENGTDTTEEITWDMPTPFAETVFHTQNIQQFTEDVKRLTAGKLIIRVHAGASLYKHPEITRAVRSGQVPAGEFLISLLGNEDPLFQVDALPLLATSYEQAEKLWQASRPEIEALLEKQNLKLLFAIPWPPQGLYTKKEINSLEDLRGTKMRVYNSLLARFVELMGGIPATVQSPEIPQAFSTGIIEAMITSPSTGVSSQSWDYVNYYYEVQAWIPKNAVIVNKTTFDALPPKQQTAILKAAEIAEKRGWEMSKEETTEKTKILEDNGMQVLGLTDELRTGLDKIRQEMIREWQARAGAVGKRVLDDFYKQMEVKNSAKERS